MSVMPDYGPGLGPGIQALADNFLNRRRQKQFDNLSATAQDLDNTNKRLSIATTYPTVSPDNGATPPLAPVNGPSFSPGDFEASLRQSFGAAPGAVAPSTFNQAGNQHAAPAPATDPGAMFQQNLQQSFAQNPTGRAGAGALNIPGNLNASRGSSGGGATSIISQLPTDVVDVPGYGKVDRYGAMKRQLFMEALKNEIDNSGKINLSDATGASAKNWREVSKPQLGDEGYAGMMGDVAGAEANARVPAAVATVFQSKQATLPLEMQAEVAKGKISLSNALAQVAARGNVEAGLQSNAQTFTAGENAKNRESQTTLLTDRLAGEFGNALNLKGYERNAHPVDKFFGQFGMGNQPKTVAPSTAILQATQQRVDWDAAAAHLQSTGDKNPSATLGPRP